MIDDLNIFIKYTNAKKNILNKEVDNFFDDIVQFITTIKQRLESESNKRPKDLNENVKTEHTFPDPQIKKSNCKPIVNNEVNKLNRINLKVNDAITIAKANNQKIDGKSTGKNKQVKSNLKRIG